MKRTVRLICMMLSLLVLSGCVFRNSTPKRGSYVKQLSDKYDADFEVFWLKNGVGRAYCLDNEDLIFDVSVDEAGNLTSDNYECRRFCYDVQERFKSYFTDSIECVCSVDKLNDGTYTNSMQDYVTKNEVTYIVLTAVSPVALTDSEIENAVLDLSLECSGVDVSVGMYSVSESDFDVIENDIKHETKLFDENSLSSYGVQNGVECKIVRYTDGFIEYDM